MKRVFEPLRALAEPLAGLVFPRACIVGGEAIEEEGGLGIVGGPGEVETGASLELGGRHAFRYLGTGALGRIPWVRRPWCPSCGQPHHGELAAEERLCPNCRELRPAPAWEAGRTAFVLEGAGRRIVHTLKYHGGEYLLHDLTQLVRLPPGLLRFARGTVLVPVPLHPTRLRERGYNQSELLARALAAGSGAPVRRLLRRTRYTTTQTRRDRAQRQANVRNAFALRRDALVYGSETYTVVDDVFTTGATLAACCATLRRGGAKRLRILTLGHG